MDLQNINTSNGFNNVNSGGYYAVLGKLHLTSVDNFPGDVFWHQAWILQCA